MYGNEIIIFFYSDSIKKLVNINVRRKFNFFVMTDDFRNENSLN